MPQHSKVKLGKHAIVIGGSMAGLVSARVLSDYFDKVTILERDTRPENPEPRKSSPQMRHVHLLLAGANKTLRDMFPGIIDELHQGGALLIDATADVMLYQYGGWRPRFESGVEAVSCTRPFLEWHIRRRVEALPNVEILYEHVAEDLITGDDHTHVRGVRIKGNGSESSVNADLIIDAAGRGTRAPRWLEALGYGRPEEIEVGIDLAYTSRFYEIPTDSAIDCKLFVLMSRLPGQRGGFILEVERGRWLVSLTGYFKDHCPADDDGFLAFAKSLPVSILYDAIKDAQPITEPVMHKIPSSRWLRYDKMSRLPEGFVVLGDSICALNPLYGQGMTMAIECARQLATTLAERSQEGQTLVGLPIVLQKKFANVITAAWILSTTMDLRFPQTTGNRPPGLGALQWLFSNFIDMCSQSEKASRAFCDLMHMCRGPEALLDPGVFFPLIAYCAQSPFVPLERRINTHSIPKAPRRTSAP